MMTKSSLNSVAHKIESARAFIIWFVADFGTPNVYNRHIMRKLAASVKGRSHTSPHDDLKDMTERLSDAVLAAAQPVKLKTSGCKGVGRNELAAHFEREHILFSGQLALSMLDAGGMVAKKGRKKNRSSNCKSNNDAGGLKEQQGLALCLGVKE